MRHMQFFQELVHAFVALLVSDVLRLQDCHNVVADGELAENRRLLRQVADAHLGTAVHRLLRNLVIVKEDPALVGAYHAHDHVECVVLPDRGPQEPDDFTLVHHDRHAVDDTAL